MQYARQDFENDGIARSGRRRPPVVQQQDVPRTETPQQPGGYQLRIVGYRVESTACPAGKSQLQARQNRLQKRIAQSRRRAGSSARGRRTS